VHPREWTYENIRVMKEQLAPMGLSLDWSREFATCDPEYQRQQQALFLDFLEAGLVYRKSGVVNWDPVDMTVLANEQVIDGKGWRSGAPVERRELAQWFFRISDHAEELLEAIDGLSRWPDKVRTKCTPLGFGRSEGAQFRFEDDGRAGGFRRASRSIRTGPDTIFGGELLRPSPRGHPLAKRRRQGEVEGLAAFNAEWPAHGHLP
jgi:Leucyl-tRNA synthetase